VPSSGERGLNIRRGLFRLWLIGSTIFAVGVTIWWLPEIKSQFQRSGLQAWLDEQKNEYLFPVFCGDARGKAGEDYSTSPHTPPGPWDTYAKPQRFDRCWYLGSRYRALYPEAGASPDRELAAHLYAQVGLRREPLQNPWLRCWRGLALP
jgi:hypothetical protein